ncbi:MAG: LacI family transcriptional regulator, partial [Chloroflexi bacterium]
MNIQHVAQQAGVSMATVSRVLNDHPDVSPATRDEVLRSARDLGYNGSRRVEGRGNRQTRLIALSVPSMRGDYMTGIVTGAVEALHDHDSRLVICSSDDALTESRSLSERLLRGTTDGALLVLSSESREELRALFESGYPIVVIEPATLIEDGIPAVATTNWAGAKAATEYLLGLGHTHIGVITGPAGGRVSADRLAGYHAALLAAGLPLVPRLVREADWTVDAGFRVALDLLALQHAPSAIFALNDAMALGVLRAARERRLNVPRDLSVVGFDDVEIASLTMPALTTVRQPL